MDCIYNFHIGKELKATKVTRFEIRQGGSTEFECPKRMEKLKTDERERKEGEGLEKPRIGVYMGLGGRRCRGMGLWVVDTWIAKGGRYSS